jgi:hypothetical protein
MWKLLFVDAAGLYIGDASWILWPVDFGCGTSNIF